MRFSAFWLASQNYHPQPLLPDLKWEPGIGPTNYPSVRPPLTLSVTLTLTSMGGRTNGQLAFKIATPTLIATPTAYVHKLLKYWFKFVLHHDGNPDSDE